jgi:methylglutaconyl-CoA hydratase
MKAFSSIKVIRKGPEGHVILNRPEVHNALHIIMIRELTEAFSELAEDPAIRVVFLKAEGENFCAGADLQWMKDGQLQSREQLEAESMELAGLFRLVAEIPLIVVAVVQGKVLGGANGLIAAADLVLAAKECQFRFPEVKLGLVPATIAPFVVRKCGLSRSADWMLTGRAFYAEEAREGGMVHFIAPAEALETEYQKLGKRLLSGGPGALQGIKTMLREMDIQTDAETLQKETASWIARFRISEEGQEGMKAFFEKRTPYWNEGKSIS